MDDRSHRAQSCGLPTPCVGLSMRRYVAGWVCASPWYPCDMRHSVDVSRFIDLAVNRV